MLLSILGQYGIETFLLVAFSFLVSLTFHEYMHAWTANYLGDDTAKLSGRLTLNPIAHLDPIGSLMILIAPIGWAKPVPVNPLRFRNQNIGDVLVSVSGPMANFFLAVVFALIYRYLPVGKESFQFFVTFFIILNLRLMIFNLLPIPPLDGSHLIKPLLRGNPKLFAAFEASGIIMLLLVVFFLGPYIIIPLSNFLFKFLTGV